MRLIDADALKEQTTKRNSIWDSVSDIYGRGLTKIIDSMPTIEERKKGKWKIEEPNIVELSYGTTAYEPVYRCSVCERVTESYLRYEEPIMPEDADFPSFCPNCGARMEVEDDIS